MTGPVDVDFAGVGADPGWDALAALPPGAVAVLRLPVSVDGLAAATRALDAAYGPGLVIRTDVPGTRSWAVLATTASDKENPRD